MLTLASLYVGNAQNSLVIVFNVTILIIVLYVTLVCYLIQTQNNAFVQIMNILFLKVQFVSRILDVNWH